MQDHQHQQHRHHHDGESSPAATLTEAWAASPSRHTHPDDDHAVHTHGQHAGHSTAMFKNRFWLTLALSFPVVYLSPMVGHILNDMAPVFPGSTWIPPILGTVIFLYGGQPFLKGGLQELKDRRPGMMLLIAMAITVAFAASWINSLGLQ